MERSRWRLPSNPEPQGLPTMCGCPCVEAHIGGQHQGVQMCCPSFLFLVYGQQCPICCCLACRCPFLLHDWVDDVMVLLRQYRVEVKSWVLAPYCLESKLDSVYITLRTWAICLDSLEFTIFLVKWNFIVHQLLIVLLLWKGTIWRLRIQL